MRTLVGVWALVVFLLSGCLSSGSSSSSDSGSGNENGSDTEFAGLYSGTFDDPTGTHWLDILAYDGRVMGLSFDADAIYEGTYSVSGSRLSGEVIGWEIDGGPFATFSIDGELSGNTHLDAEFEPIDGQGSTGDLSVEIDPESDRNLDPTLISGTYAYQLHDGSRFELTINVDGSVQGGDSLGCFFAGDIEIPEANLNIMQLSVDVSGASCIDQGSFSGLATLLDVEGTDWLIFAASSSNAIYVDAVPRE